VEEELEVVHEALPRSGLHFPKVLGVVAVEEVEHPAEHWEQEEAD